MDLEAIIFLETWLSSSVEFIRSIFSVTTPYCLQGLLGYSSLLFILLCISLYSKNPSETQDVTSDGEHRQAVYTTELETSVADTTSCK